MPFPNFYGNAGAVQTLVQMAANGRIPQTILLSGPAGIGKATLARRFGASLLGDGPKIEKDDLSLPSNIEIVEGREKWTADKRNDDPLLFSTHPDFVTFAPDGPLRQITIPQMRLLRERAQFKPLRGIHRVFLIDHLERANEQAANSLLKVLEEPPEHIILIATVENLYDLLPTIRSRAVALQLTRLSDDEMNGFVQTRNLSDGELRVAISEGCPGLAANLDLDVFRVRRGVMLAAFECAAGIVPFSTWIQQSETFTAKKSERLELYTKPAYDVLEDVLAAAYGRRAVRNRDIQARLTKLAEHTTFDWIVQAVRAVDELVLMLRRNIQKTSALDAMIIKLRNRLQPVSA